MPNVCGEFMANGLPLQELRSWLEGSLNVNNGANVAINSTALFGFFDLGKVVDFKRGESSWVETRGKNPRKFEI